MAVTPVTLPGLDGVLATECHDDRDHRCRALSSPDGHGRARDDEIDLEAHELRGQRRQPIRVSIGELVLDDDVSPDNVAAPTESLRHHLAQGGALERGQAENADPVDPACRLSPCGRRQRHRPDAKNEAKGKHRFPPHVTSSGVSP